MKLNGILERQFQSKNAHRTITSGLPVSQTTPSDVVTSGPAHGCSTTCKPVDSPIIVDLDGRAMA
jgi:hypothetical protein